MIMDEKEHLHPLCCCAVVHSCNQAVHFDGFKGSMTVGRLAVICDMLLTTHLVTLVMVCVWRIPLVLPLAFYFVFAVIQSLLLSSTAEKVPTGACLVFAGNDATNEHPC